MLTTKCTRALFESRVAHGLIEISNTVNGTTSEIT